MTYEFGPFRIDPERELVLRDGEPLAITPKAFEVLLVLVRHGHELVSKDELMRAVWPDRVVEEANLSQCIFVLRKLLGDTHDARRYIVTVPGRGYRFAEQVRTLPQDEPEAATPQGPSGIDDAALDPPASSTRRPMVRRPGFAVIGATAIVIVLLAAAYFIRRPAPPAVVAVPATTTTTATAPAPAPTAKSVAVLPFENLSADKDNKYFVAGMQDLILTKLADISGLKVIARTSTAMYASHPDNLKAIGEQLGVATILEGSVQKQGDNVLIDVQLIDVQTNAHVWAHSYQRTLDNIFGVEGEVAEKVAQALDAKLSASQAARLAAVPTTNQTAYDAFLRAEYRANLGDLNFDTASWKAAIPLYKQALANAPDFALAYAHVSRVESVLAWFGGNGEAIKQLTQQARSDAERAIQLAPALSAAHVALGYSDYYGRGDYADALRAFAGALALEPNNAAALAARGFVEARQGRFDAAITSLQQALALDPRNSALAGALGVTYANISRYSDAERWYRRALAIQPDNLAATVQLSDAILLASGDIPRALAAAQGDAVQLKLQRASLLSYQRKFHAASALLDSVPDTPYNFPNVPKALQQAEIYRLLDDTSRARALYMQALPVIRARLAQESGIKLVFVWQNLAAVQLGLGQSSDALRSMAKAQSIIANSHDRVYGPPATYVNATLYAAAGRPRVAVSLLSTALASPGIGWSFSPVCLWIDPDWDPIRHDPRFQALLKKYDKYKPAAIPAASASTAAPPPGS